MGSATSEEQAKRPYYQDFYKATRLDILALSHVIGNIEGSSSEKIRFSRNPYVAFSPSFYDADYSREGILGYKLYALKPELIPKIAALLNIEEAKTSFYEISKHILLCISALDLQTNRLSAEDYGAIGYEIAANLTDDDTLLGVLTWSWAVFGVRNVESRKKGRYIKSWMATDDLNYWECLISNAKSNKKKFIDAASIALDGRYMIYQKMKRKKLHCVTFGFCGFYNTNISQQGTRENFYRSIEGSELPKKILVESLYQDYLTHFDQLPDLVNKELMRVATIRPGYHD